MPLPSPRQSKAVSYLDITFHVRKSEQDSTSSPACRTQSKRSECVAKSSSFPISPVAECRRELAKVSDIDFQPVRVMSTARSLDAHVRLKLRAQLGKV